MTIAPPLFSYSPGLTSKRIRQSLALCAELNSLRSTLPSLLPLFRRLNARMRLSTALLRALPSLRDQIVQLGPRHHILPPRLATKWILTQERLAIRRRLTTWPTMANSAVPVPKESARNGGESVLLYQRMAPRLPLARTTSAIESMALTVASATWQTAP